jgi:hypothetical protein
MNAQPAAVAATDSIERRSNVTARRPARGT